MRCGSRVFPLLAVGVVTTLQASLERPYQRKRSEKGRREVFSNDRGVTVTLMTGSPDKGGLGSFRKL